MTDTGVSPFSPQAGPPAKIFWAGTELILAGQPVEVVALSDGEALIGVYFGSARSVPRFDSERHVNDPGPLAPAIEQLQAYARGELTAFDLPLRPIGSAFQIEVWKCLSLVPYGTTTTYGAVARQVGRPTGSRAVGTAVGANPLSIVVPCHRVIGADGSLTGYAGGLENKIALLRLEGVTAI